MRNAAATPTEHDLLAATFRLGRGLFALDTSLIQEVVMLGEITPVHHAPPHVAGIRNLRGRIVTVIDLRARLDVEADEPTPDSRILIVEWKAEPVGLLVDRVEETVAFHARDLQPSPPNLNGVNARNLQGVFAAGDRLAALLEPAAILAAEPASAELPSA